MSDDTQRGRSVRVSGAVSFLPSRRMVIALLILALAGIAGTLGLTYAAHGAPISARTLPASLGVACGSVAVLTAIGFTIRISSGRPGEPDHPLTFGIVFFLGLLVATACFAHVDAMRDDYETDPSCRLKLPAPTAADAACSVQPVRIVGAEIARRRARSFLIDVRTADGRTAWIDLGPDDPNVLWREAVAKPNLPGFARSYRGAIVRVASTDAWSTTTATPDARLRVVLLIVFVLGAAGIIAAGSALRESFDAMTKRTLAA